MRVPLGEGEGEGPARRGPLTLTLSPKGGEGIGFALSFWEGAFWERPFWERVRGPAPPPRRATLPPRPALSTVSVDQEARRRPMPATPPPTGAPAAAIVAAVTIAS